MSWLNQALAITLMNLRNLPGRLGASLVIVVGIAGVVTVLVALLAMAKGFESTLKSTGHDDRVIVLRGGANNEMSSVISNEHAAIIANMPGILKTDKGPLAAAETYVIADIKKRSNNSDANLPMRGVQPNSFLIRDETRIIEGRNIEFGKFEMIAGKNAANQFQGLDVGNSIHIRGADWKVVGIFSSAGNVHESEVYVDNVILASNLNRGGANSSMILTLESPLDFDRLEQALDADPRLETTIKRESTFYSEQSEGVTTLITRFGYSVAFIMAIGAIFGALNTMYSAVSTRSVEIATLRALGFGAAPIVISVMIEALILALIGGLIGSVIAYLVFNGYTASTMNNVTFSQVSFNFSVTRELLVQGITWSCVLGLVGGLFPAVNAARQPVTVALRGM
ncbi:MAG: ABC transporter permease [Gammaproteobacteria bacterium]|nr:ABC transporter permease [Gammaproteobacteria bacterium]